MLLVRFKFHQYRLGRLHFLPCILNVKLHAAPCIHETLALTLQRGNLLLQFRLVKQVCIARQDSHILREVHAVGLVHRSLVDGSCAHCAGLQLRDEGLLAVQQIKLVGIQCMLHGIDDAVHRVVIVQLCHLVALSHGTTIALLQVARPPGNVKMMDSHGPFLCIDTRAKHRR